LEELNLTNFKTNIYVNQSFMLSGCQFRLRSIIKTKYKNIKKEAFDLLKY